MAKWILALYAEINTKTTNTLSTNATIGSLMKFLDSLSSITLFEACPLSAVQLIKDNDLSQANEPNQNYDSDDHYKPVELRIPLSDWYS